MGIREKEDGNKARVSYGHLLVTTTKQYISKPIHRLLNLDDHIHYYTKLYYTILYYTILYYTILYYTILYFSILFYLILIYCIILYF